MKLKPARLAPALIAACVIVLVSLVHLARWDFVERFERTTFDVRVRHAAHFSPPVSTNLGFVYIDDASIEFVRNNTVLGYNYGLYWPRQVYGRLVRELAAQRTRAMAFDVIFGELRPDHPQVQMSNGRLMESDHFFALQMHQAGNVILADGKDLSPPELFATNALALADISTDSSKDSDGVLRRAQAFHVRKKWHPLFKQVAEDPGFGVDLNRARVQSNSVVLVRSQGEPIVIPLDPEGRFELADFVGDTIPAGMQPKARPYEEERIWNLGLVLAAQELGLDLDSAVVNWDAGEIVLRGGGARRVIPIDEDGFFQIDWAIRYDDPRLFKEPIQKLLIQERLRLDGTNDIPALWAGRLAVIGSLALGNDLTDRGPTPLERNTFLASAHWNIANSLLFDRFIRRTSLSMDLAIIFLLGVLAAFFTWRLRILVASCFVVVLIGGYLALAWVLYIEHRFWLPVIVPVGGALLMTHVCLVTWRGIFEQAEQRRVKSIFSRIVSPNIVYELLGAESLSLGGARREVSILFADIRGFTEFTDRNQEQAEAYAAEKQLQGAEREQFFNEQARETLATVNAYLAAVADIVKKHDGTLDKYIGDCVMAFWGAPTPNLCHARACVRAAIEAQRRLAELNASREEANRQRALENAARVSAGLPPKPLSPVLSLGSGINTGHVTVGLMGSEAHISNYTVFGREVNLASRLESLSGRGRILISEATYRHLLRDDPGLAATCISLPDATVKGIRVAVKIFEVPWQLPAGQVPAAPPEAAGKAVS